LQLRLDKQLGRRDQLNGGFAFDSSRGDTANVFNFVDTTDTLGIDAHVNWSHQFHHNIFAVLGYHFTRRRTLVRPEFEGRKNISGDAGITGNDQDPKNWGPPYLNFSSGIVALNDANSEFNRDRTDAFAEAANDAAAAHNFVRLRLPETAVQPILAVGPARNVVVYWGGDGSAGKSGGESGRGDDERIRLC
jgi:hypothetical protein